MGERFEGNFTMSESTTAAGLASDIEQLATDAGATINTKVEGYIGDGAEIVDLASAALSQRFGIDLGAVIGGLSLIILGADKLFTTFKKKTVSTAS